MWQLLSLAALLLLVLASPQPEDRPKAVVSLHPQWDRVLRHDSVTLMCQGAYPHGDNSTQWFHNGSSLSNQTSSYVIASAEVEDSGEYRCQTGLSTLSDPVQLQVHPAWLLLQAPQWVFQEGEPISLQCHSWKNVTVRKVQYFQDGRGKQFSYKNTKFHIPKAMRRHGGSYFCRGIIGTHNVSSEAANITVLGPAVPSISPLFPLWPQITFCLAMGLLFAVDTGLYFSVQRDLQQSLRNKRYGKVTWSKSPEDPYKQ
ncbi:low affinity immunoglobulin gamma Fc region receptor III-B-like isoform X1 [Pteropus vampyrus]|uniref:low affinity immunoglobulin gamma Fc region receptor III-B-like isoform X1 n=1 Tax=Pteropus vampyrus TaxID=132908 RepID=UPI0005BD9B95|nr:low affinity immunoglobulin gamma Fc region receptor III-B-like isoform X1 [Pteropus vampyrus]